MKSVAEYIKEAREEAGLKQFELAQKIAISASALNKIEKGYRLPSDPLLHRIQKEIRLREEVWASLKAATVQRRGERKTRSPSCVSAATLILGETAGVKAFAQSAQIPAAYRDWLVSKMESIEKACKELEQ